MAEIKNIKNQARANTMTNLEKYNKIFIGMFHKTEEELPGLKYRGIIHMDTPDVLDFTSYEKGKEVLGRYGVTIE